MTHRTFRWLGRISLAAVAVSSLGAPGGIPAARANQTPPSGSSAVVVRVVDRGRIGKMLATAPAGRSLYVLSEGTCTKACLTKWPPLLMPKGASTPKGASCLSTKKTRRGRLQVTYHKKRLYLFRGDSGTSVKGNGKSGFFAAVVSPGCP